MPISAATDQHDGVGLQGNDRRQHEVLRGCTSGRGSTIGKTRPREISSGNRRRSRSPGEIRAAATRPAGGRRATAIAAALANGHDHRQDDGGDDPRPRIDPTGTMGRGRNGVKGVVRHNDAIPVPVSVLSWLPALRLLFISLHKRHAGEAKDIADAAQEVAKAESLLGLVDLPSKPRSASVRSIGRGSRRVRSPCRLRLRHVG